MAFTPTNRVYLLDTPLDNTQKNQLRFNSRSAQQSYFMSCKVREIDNIDYIKKDDKILIDGNLDDYWRCNYVMYQNHDYNDRWFYAFITKMEWESERTIAIYIKTDVYQTWRLDCDILQSFVIREHVKDDTIGKNIVAEGLEYGDYIVNSFVQTETLNELWYVLAVSDTVTNGENVVRGIYGNVYSGLAFQVFSPSDVDNMSQRISDYISASKGDAIQFIYTIPKALIPNITSGTVIPNGTDIGYVDFKFNTFSDIKFKTIDDYTPKNNKMYCYPYNTLYVSNNNGNCAEYHFEDFYDFENSTYLEFWIDGTITPNPSLLLYPLGYKCPDGNSNVYSPEYGLPLSNFPFCSWASDTYKAWLAQNAVTSAVTLGVSAGAIIGGALTGNVAGVGGGAIGVASQMAQIYKASLQPDQAKGNTNGGNINVATYRQNYSFARLSIKKEYAKRIDDYFTMFGYKVNSLKVPEEHSRENWNYIQTIDINITGSLPSADMEELKAIYNNGVTLWHDASNFCNYSRSNKIL